MGEEDVSTSPVRHVRILWSDISHPDISQPDGRGGRFNFPGQTCPDPLIALTRRVFLSIYSATEFLLKLPDIFDHKKQLNYQNNLVLTTKTSFLNSPPQPSWTLSSMWQKQLKNREEVVPPEWRGVMLWKWWFSYLSYRRLLMRHRLINKRRGLWWLWWAGNGIKKLVTINII